MDIRKPVNYSKKIAREVYAINSLSINFESISILIEQLQLRIRSIR